MSDAAVTYPWAPTPDECAEVMPAYTRGGFDDDDRIYAGAERGAFDDSTSPTEEDVVGLITAACDEVAGRVGVVIPLAQYGLARTAAKWHVAMTVAQQKMPSGTDDAAGEYRAFNSNFVASLSALVELARMPTSVRLS
jgi:hypothetical protein